MSCISSKFSALQQYTRYHVTAFVLTFLSYAMLHATRKSFSNVKTTMSAEWTPSFVNGSTDDRLTPAYRWTERHLFTSHDDAEEFMGTLDASFMFAYAVGLFVSGFIADRHDLRLVLCIGMTLTAVMVFVYGCVFEWLHWYSQPSYIAVWILNGLLQSTGWPCVVTVMGNWFGRGSRGLVLGVWSSCASVGNILGSVMVSAVLDYGYDFAFLLTATVLLAFSVIDLFGLVISPEEVGLHLPQESDDGSSENRSENGGHNAHSFQLEIVIANEGQSDSKDPPANGVGARQENGVAEKKVSETNSKKSGQSDPAHKGQENGAGVHCQDKGSSQDKETSCPRESISAPEGNEDTAHAVNFFTALLLPGVVPYALCYAFLKLVNYSFFFWLPFYLSSAYGMAETEADKLSIWYDMGGIVGGTLAGFISDRLQTRTVVVTPMLLLAVPMLFVYGMTGVAGTLLTNGILLFVLGILIGGVANLISAAISADLGRQKALKGNPKALSTVTGILDGTGSMGAALGQVAVPHLQVAFGWRTVFYLFMVCTLLTALCIVRIFWQEAKDLLRRLRH